MSEKPWTPREQSLYRDVKKSVADAATSQEQLRATKRELQDLRTEHNALLRAFRSRSA